MVIKNCIILNERHQIYRYLFYLKEPQKEFNKIILKKILIIYIYIIYKKVGYKIN